MFFRQVVTRRNGKKYTYLKLIENYRENGKIKQRVIANLGNIDNLNREKVNALISSLNQLANAHDTGTITTSHATTNHQSSKLHDWWDKLNLSEFLQKNLPSGAPEATPWLVKAMVLQKILYPGEHRPITVSYPALNLPELKDKKIAGIDFYRAATALSVIKDELSQHLYEMLQKWKKEPPSIYTTLVKSEYTGNECGINTAGTTYQVRPFKKSNYLSITVFPPGLPIACCISESNNPGELLEAEAKKSLTPNTCMVWDGNKFDSTATKQASYYIKLLPPEEFASIPVSTSDLWSNNDAFTFNSLWVKEITKPHRRYIISHDLSPDTATDNWLEENLARAEADMAKIQSLVNEKKLRRKKTILKKIEEALAQYDSQKFFHYQLDLDKLKISYHRKEEVIQKEKTLRRTRVLETNMNSTTPMDVINAFQGCNSVAKYTENITDIVKVPVIYPYNELHHGKEYITGQVLIYLLSYNLQYLVTNM